MGHNLQIIKTKLIQTDDLPNIENPQDPRLTQHDTTVDGRNPAPVDKQFISLFTGISTSQVLQDFSINSMGGFLLREKCGKVWGIC